MHGGGGLFHSLLRFSAKPSDVPLRLIRKRETTAESAEAFAEGGAEKFRLGLLRGDGAAAASQNILLNLTGGGFW